MADLAAGFRTARFGAWDGLVGCIDGTHIPIIAPSESPEAFFNRKGFYSLNVLAVADAQLLFRYVSVGAPGSLHDTRVLRLSGLPTIMERIPYYLLGDEGYPLLPWLLTIFSDAEVAEDPARRAFNSAHKRTRQIVERAFGLLTEIEVAHAHSAPGGLRGDCQRYGLGMFHPPQLVCTSRRPR